MLIEIYDEPMMEKLYLLLKEKLVYNIYLLFLISIETVRKMIVLENGIVFQNLALCLFQIQYFKYGK